MTPLGILSYVLTAIVFVMWAFAVFRVTFGMRKRAAARTGKSFPGPVDTLREWGHWLRDPAYSKERRQLFFQTIAVIALSVLLSMNLATGGE